MGPRGLLDWIPLAHSGPVLSLDWCNTEDSGWLASAGFDRTVKVKQICIPAEEVVLTDVHDRRSGSILRLGKPVKCWLRISLMGRSILHILSTRHSPYAVLSGARAMKQSLP